MKVVKVLAWILLSIAALCAVCSVAVVIEGKPDYTSPLLGFVIIGAFFGLPGVLLLRVAMKSMSDESSNTLLLGLMRTLDEFTVAELAQKLGRPEAETEQRIVRAAAANQIELVFHRSDRKYMRRDRIRRAHQVFDKCGACGAGLAHELSLEGEAITCPYCGSRVDAQAR